MRKVWLSAAVIRATRLMRDDIEREGVGGEEGDDNRADSYFDWAVLC